MTVFNTPVPPDAYAIIRYGMGYPALGSPTTAAGMLRRLQGPDAIAALWPVTGFQAARRAGISVIEAQKLKRKDRAAGDIALKQWREWIRDATTGNFVTEMTRAVETDDPLRERLQWFWANHFTARPRSIHLAAGRGGYIETAIRPNLTGRFADLLIAAVTHPFMLIYLDQHASVGPKSVNGIRSGAGLNENLAREVMELHTLGVGATYGQADVTQLAELLTGLTFNMHKGAHFQPLMAEPGAETVLGKTYGGDPPELGDIHAVLEDLAAHPATAPHLCTKIAAHFTADEPDADLVKRMVAAWRDTDGRLLDVYAAMLDHPAAWSGFGAKVRAPVEYMAATLRGVGTTGADLAARKPGQVQKHLLRALRFMGQDHGRPTGPDGWPDRAEAWIHPHGLAARIDWAMTLAAAMKRAAPDPRDFVRDALGGVAGSQLVWAAGAAESRIQGVGVVLASVEFNRR